MVPRMRTSWWVVLGLGLAIAACGPPAAAPPPREYPGPLRAPSAYPTEVSIDQTVTAIHPQGSDSFRAVIEKRGDTLIMVGLGPHGGRAFVLAQEGDEVRFESQLPRELPFPARYMLLDVHRAWLLGLAGAPLADGEHRDELEGGDRRDLGRRSADRAHVPPPRRRAARAGADHVRRRALARSLGRPSESGGARQRVVRLPAGARGDLPTRTRAGIAIDSQPCRSTSASHATTGNSSRAS
jgi:hypothetical protein